MASTETQRLHPTVETVFNKYEKHNDSLEARLLELSVRLADMEKTMPLHVVKGDLGPEPLSANVISLTRPKSAPSVVKCISSCIPCHKSSSTSFRSSELFKLKKIEELYSREKEIKNRIAKLKTEGGIGKSQEQSQKKIQIADAPEAMKESPEEKIVNETLDVLAKQTLAELRAVENDIKMKRSQPGTKPEELDLLKTKSQHACTKLVMIKTTKSLNRDELVTSDENNAEAIKIVNETLDKLAEELTLEIKDIEGSLRITKCPADLKKLKEKREHILEKLNLVKATRQMDTSKGENSESDVCVSAPVIIGSEDLINKAKKLALALARVENCEPCCKLLSSDVKHIVAGLQKLALFCASAKRDAIQSETDESMSMSSTIESLNARMVLTPEERPGKRRSSPGIRSPTRIPVSVRRANSVARSSSPRNKDCIC